MGLVEKTMHGVLGGVVLLWLWTSCWQKRASKFTVALTFPVTFIQRAPAAASPQEAPALSRANPWAAGRREMEREPCLSWQTVPSPLREVLLPLQKGQWRVALTGRTVVIPRAGWAFSTSPSFQETHLAFSSLYVLKRREKVEGGCRPSDRSKPQDVGVNLWSFIWDGVCNVPTSYFSVLRVLWALDLGLRFYLYWIPKSL